MTPKFLPKARKFLSISHSLATGPNKRNSQFGKILESIFRKGYFTLQTIVTLADIAEKDDQYEVIVGGSILALSRRVLEDMIYMEYINVKNKKVYSKQFVDFLKVEQKHLIDFTQKLGMEIDQKIIDVANEKYGQTPAKLRKRHNWSGQSVEQIIEWLAQKNRLPGTDKEVILALYTAGNQKIHTSPGDILDHSKQEWITSAAQKDIEIGLMITHGSLIKICLLLLEEIDTTSEIKKAVQDCWKDINPPEPPKI